MNPNATEFIPKTAILGLWEMPFFQQRLERFLTLQHRILHPTIKDLVLLDTFPPVPPVQKTQVVFRATYKGIPLQYEANNWRDPRTGVFTSSS